MLRISPPDDAGFLYYERRMVAQEPQFHSLLRSETTVPVAEIMAFDGSHHLVNHDYLLMERLPGWPLTETHLSSRMLDGVLEQVGGYLAQMHGLVADRFGYLRAHRPMAPQRTWVEAFGVMGNRLTDAAPKRRTRTAACSGSTGLISTGKPLPRFCTWMCGARTSWWTMGGV